MKKKFAATAIAAMSLFAAADAAQAQNRPVARAPAPMVNYYSWSGLYGGISAGYAWGDASWDSPALTQSPGGGIVGGTIGHNWQTGALVLGFEGDLSWSNFSDKVACGTFTCETKNDWLATMRGRIGYAFDRLLPYVTGGAAFGNIDARSTNPAAPGDNTIEIGWTIGAGFEYAFSGNLSAKIEYLYVDFGSFNCGAACSGLGTSNVSMSANIFRVGLNYRFFGPLVSRF
jgi:outer membrane immunogenic protein